MWIEIETLEHHADALAHAVDVEAAGQHVDAIDKKSAVVGPLKEVAAAQQRAFARTRWSNEEDEFSLGDPKVHAFQNLGLAVTLDEPPGVDERTPFHWEFAPVSTAACAESGRTLACRVRHIRGRL